MNFVGLTLHGFRALMVFAEDVLVRVGLMCVLVSSASIVLAVVATLLKLAGYATPGWFSMALGVLFTVFLQTGTLTLMTLMLSGIVRGTIQKPGAYRECGRRHRSNRRCRAALNSASFCVMSSTGWWRPGCTSRC